MNNILRSTYINNGHLDIAAESQPNTVSYDKDCGRILTYLPGFKYSDDELSGISSHDAPSGLPRFAKVGIVVLGRTFHLDEDTEY